MEQSGQKQCQPQVTSIISRLYCRHEGGVWQKQGWLGNLTTTKVTSPVSNYHHVPNYTPPPPPPPPLPYIHKVMHSYKHTRIEYQVRAYVECARILHHMHIHAHQRIHGMNYLNDKEGIRPYSRLPESSLLYASMPEVQTKELTNSVFSPHLSGLSSRR